MKKKTLLLISVGIAAVGLGFLFSLKKTPSPASNQPPVIRNAAAPPSMVFVPDEPTNVVFSYTGKQEIFPSSLLVYSFVGTQTDTAKIGAAFGFSTNPIKKTIGSQSVTIWNDDTKELSLYSDGNTNNWSYSLKTVSGGGIKISSVAEAKEFIEKLFPLPKGGTLTFSKKFDGPFDGFITNDSIQPTLTEFDFSFLLGKYPLVDTSFNESAASVIIDQNGLLRSFSFASLPTVQTDTESPQKTLLSVQEAIIALNNHKGKLLSAQKSENTVFWGESPSFQSVELKDVKIIYYPNAATNEVTPFFFFTGLAVNREGTSLSVEYVVSAIE